jgi:streptogrisin C
VNPTTARRVRRAVLPLLAVATVAALAAPAYADPPPSSDSGDSGDTTGKASVALADPPTSGGGSDSGTGGKVAAPSMPGDDLAPGMIAAMQRDLHLTADQARAGLARQYAAGQAEHKLRRALGPSFGGAWLASGDQRPVVGITDPAKAADVRAAGAQPQLVHRSQAELDALMAKLDTAPRPASVSAWYVDVAANQIVIEADRAALMEATAFARSWLADPTAVRVDASTGRAKPYDDVRGGDEFLAQVGADDNYCSTGFSVNKISAPSTQGFVTAGHCVMNGGDTYRFNNVLLGSVRGRSFPVNDHAFVETTSAWAPRPEVNLYDGGALTVQGWNDAPVGAWVCSAGLASHWRCGTIEARNASVYYPDGTVTGTIQTSVCIRPGDSGGPVVSGSQAQGMVSGGHDCTSYVQPIVNALHAYGLRLLTGGATTTPPRIMGMGCEYSYGNQFSCSLGYYHPDGASIRWQIGGNQDPRYDDSLELTGFCGPGQSLFITATVFNASGSDTMGSQVTCDGGQ